MDTVDFQILDGGSPQRIIDPSVFCPATNMPSLGDVSSR
jgi:hypothetical protein